MVTTDYFDKRYFYFKDEVGQPTCGLARFTLLRIYREWQLSTFGDWSWYWAISRSNPTVRGYLAEQVCLATISRKGLGAVTPDLGKALTVEHFATTPVWSNLIKSSESHRLYLPNAFNYPSIDGAILQVDRTKKQAHLLLIQVTLAKKHSDSESLFYRNQWDDWTNGLQGFQVQSTFVWIDELGPRENKVQYLITHRATTWYSSKLNRVVFVHAPTVFYYQIVLI